MYKSRTHLRLLKEWQPVDAVIQRLEGTGFDLVHRINMDYRTTIDFLLALIDHYSVDLSCFIIGDQRITPKLDDVARITGFPIDVLPVLGRDYKANECPDVCNELLLSPELLHPKKRCDVILRKLLPFKNILPVLVGAGLDPYVRAYVLYVIGCFLTPPRGHSSVPCMYLSLLRDVDAIRNYAWGAALLCQLHHSMAEFKRAMIDGKNPQVMSFCAPFLTVFFYEHIPIIPCTLYDVDIYKENFEERELFSIFPLMMGWSHAVERKSKNSYIKKKREEFDVMLTNENIVWQPYARLPDNFLPHYLVG
ncbi:protein MAIN-LIKE 1-like [Olea europaea var. sylvestris]|uniref:protein MAIN-LIKE 1-like n=1 Tax=Olea europaea var. sylvestris TaxID=158386 RepID=UPI000C1D05D5|nr:protein MAIN-LIKE 1-like [Olea europaea var. sylvestris]